MHLDVWRNARAGLRRKAGAAQAALSYLGAGIAPGWVLAQQCKTDLDFIGVEAYGGLSFSADRGF